MVVALENVGFQTGKAIGHVNDQQLHKQFQQQLDLLHEDYRSRGHKTIILIDGLDHIAREQRPQRSLLQVLPFPEQIRDGVYVVLGSQTDQLVDLPDQVQYAIEQPARRIEMQPLSRAAVARIVERANVSVRLSTEQREQLYVLSGGHPLALTYLLGRLDSLQPDQEAQEVLDRTERYAGNIEAQYYSYWRQVAGDAEVIHMLGLLARWRGMIDLRWFRSWADRRALDLLVRNFGHFFRREDPSRWYFFHNSFRLFLLAQTSATIPGVDDDLEGAELHRELADRCAEAPATSPQAWEEIYHRVMASQHALVLERATPDWFRSQTLAGRPFKAVGTDVQIALRSVSAQRDAVALTRLAFAALDAHDRSSYLEASSLVPFMLALAEPERAVGHVRDGNQLRVSPKEALSLCGPILEAGLREEARRIFDLAEPLDLLAAQGPIDDVGSLRQEEQHDLLEAWAGAAVDFYPIDQLCRMVRRIEVGKDPWRQKDAATVTRRLQNSLLYQAGEALAAQGRWEDFTTLIGMFDLQDGNDRGNWFWLHVRAWTRCIELSDTVRARYFVEQVLCQQERLRLNDEARAVLAEAMLRVLDDPEQAQTWISNVAEPGLPNDYLKWQTLV